MLRTLGKIDKQLVIVKNMFDQFSKSQEKMIRISKEEITLDFYSTVLKTVT